MESLFRFLWNGFGLGSSSIAARATGIALCFLLSAVFIAYFIIRWIVRLVMKNKASQNTPVAD